ncbi:MAG: MaoC family dehydratase N-terminal domain-containing protein [Alphaproteobacteria bacterium]|nr:MaoC family dehydratase N-terminal domain-containing protein [Alphaproteobacteria bacterium]
MEKLNVEAWVGREGRDASSVTAFQAQKIHATVGKGVAPKSGDPLPSLWHWCAFTPTETLDALDIDGHVRGAALLPPVHLPRRMWAGGSLTFHRPLHVGEPLERSTRIRSLIEKQGKTGPMVLLTLDHVIHGTQGLAIEERQDIVYLQIPETFTPPPKKDLPAAPQEMIETPETLLFRYSAITFNAHRIHYDQSYAQTVEQYPGLVVHGPLQATFLMRAATRHKGRSPFFFEFRSVHPMFAGATCDIACQEDEEGLALWTGQNGHQCMQARAVWEETQ